MVKDIMNDSFRNQRIFGFSRTSSLLEALVI